MSLKKLLELGSATVLSLSSLLFISIPAAHAAGVTWDGSDCTIGSPDCSWNDTNNWVGGVLPVNGDDVIIDQSVNQGALPGDNDIASLSLNSLTFINNRPTSDPNYTLKLSQPLTITNAITQATSDTTAIPTIQGSITLGGNVTVTGNFDINFTDTSPSSSATINLNGNSLTFSDAGNTSGSPIIAISIPITGAGSVVYNAPQTNFQMNGASTYTGTTSIIATALPVGLGVSQTGVALFGTSSVTIEPGGSASFNSDSTATVSNAITITGTTTGSPVTSLSFGCNLSCSAVTINVANITLNGDTRFSNSGATVTINLAGITANSHCIEYLEPIGTSGTFQGGPSGCQVSASGGGSASAADAAAAAAAAPKTPNTGLAAMVAHPFQTLLAATATAGALLAIGLRLKPVKRTN